MGDWLAQNDTHNDDSNDRIPATLPATLPTALPATAALPAALRTKAPAKLIRPMSTKVFRAVRTMALIYGSSLGSSLLVRWRHASSMHQTSSTGMNHETLS